MTFRTQMQGTKSLLEKYGIQPDPTKDQFMLNNTEAVARIVEYADLHRTDIVLEIGAGPGNLTKELAKKAGKVIAYEIDQRYEPILKNLPENVEIHYEDAIKAMGNPGKRKHKASYNKIVSNLPYSFCETLLHKIAFLDYDKVILLVPKIYAKKINSSPVSGSFFEALWLELMTRNSFYPTPRTDSVVIELKRLPDPIATANLPLFLRQYMYQHEDQMPRNALMEGIISFFKLTRNRAVTKNEARKIVSDASLDKELLEVVVRNNWGIYDEVTRHFT